MRWVWRGWRRMCKFMCGHNMCEYDGCKLFRVKKVCEEVYTDKECEGDYNYVEQVVTQWAAEHPEPQYPTWAEWLESMHVVNPIISPDESSQYLLKAWYYDSPIPADIAQKLGLEPKEDA